MYESKSSVEIGLKEIGLDWVVEGNRSRDKEIMASREESRNPIFTDREVESFLIFRKAVKHFRKNGTMDGLLAHPSSVNPLS